MPKLLCGIRLKLKQTNECYTDMTATNDPTWHTATSQTYQVNSVAISGDGQRCIYGTSSEYGTGQFNVNCYSGQGQLNWSQPVSGDSATQGVFWVAISTDGAFAAAGGEVVKDSGFLTAYNAETGTQLLSESLSSRVNQVSLSSDGQFLLAVYDNTAQLYLLNQEKTTYSLVSEQNLSPYYLNSAEIAGNGESAVVSAMLYSDDEDSSTSGAIFNYAIEGSQLTLRNKNPLDQAGPMRVAITANGEAFGASLHDGSCVVYKQTSVTSLLWHYTPDVSNLSVAYAFDLTINQSGQLIVACGANVYDSQNGGYLYLLTAKWDGSSYQPEFLWGAPTEYAANPGVSLDLNAQYVTATDGKPSDPPNESPGNFYLFDVATGSLQWRYPTTQMNWPMVLAADAQSVFGGSDDGAVYYWTL